MDIINQRINNEYSNKIIKTHACGGKSIDHFIDAFLGINCKATAFP